METREVIRQISAIKEITNAALEACKRDKEAPKTLQETVAAFNTDLSRALNDVEKTDDESRIVECIDDLEQSADRTKEALEDADHASAQTRAAVLRVHTEMSRLKRQVH